MINLNQQIENSKQNQNENYFIGTIIYDNNHEIICKLNHYWFDFDIIKNEIGFQERTYVAYCLTKNVNSRDELEVILKEDWDSYKNRKE